MKKIFTFILILTIWLLSGLLFKYDYTYYELLNVPSFLLNATLNSILSIIMYILITISIMEVSKNYKIIGNNDYFFLLIINYFANMFFPLMFYNLKSPFLGFIINLIIIISTFFLSYETKKLNKKAFYILIPYLVYCSYTFLNSLLIWFMNF